MRWCHSINAEIMTCRVAVCLIVCTWLCSTKMLHIKSSNCVILKNCNKILSNLRRDPTTNLLKTSTKNEKKKQQQRQPLKQSLRSLRLLSVQFTWMKSVKPKGSILIGTSPEFEMALYTLAFLSSKKESIRLLVIDPEDHDGDGKKDRYKLEIVMHRFHGGRKLGTAFPIGH